MTLAHSLRVGVIGVTVVALGVSVSSAALAAGSTVNTATSSNFGTVLTNAQGFALYTLPSDHNGMSTCTGSCVAVWPALTVPAGTTPTAGTGVPGTVTSVLQSNGTYQVTYNGAPLYTFVGDTSPGQVSGNNVGGFTVVEISGASTSPTTSPTTSPPASTTGTTAPATPTTSVAGSTTPTTRALAAPSAPESAATSAPTAAAAAGASSSPGSSSTASSSSAPTALASTGPGPALLWMVVVGAVLVALSMAMLMLLSAGDGMVRRAVRQAVQAGGWLVGR